MTEEIYSAIGIIRFLINWYIRTFIWRFFMYKNYENSWVYYSGDTKGVYWCIKGDPKPYVISAYKEWFYLRDSRGITMAAHTSQLRKATNEEIILYGK